MSYTLACPGRTGYPIRVLEDESTMAQKKISLAGFPVEDLDAQTLATLQEAARKCRAWAVTMPAAANSGHPAGSLSSMEMFLTAFAAADLTPENCDGFDRDFVVVSHGHTSPGVYAALGWLGFIDPAEAMAHFRNAGSPFQGHVEREVPGVDWGTGNLGQGLSAGVGFALAQRARRHQGRVFVLMGDGEQVKGQNAEARRVAAKEGLSGITAFVDYNHIQISGKIEEIMPSKIRDLWEADGWEVLDCDGHDFQAIYKAMRVAAASPLPTVLLCHTVMGKGVSFMEGIPDYHGKAATGDLYRQAMSELGAPDSLLEEAMSKRQGAFPEGRPVPVYELRVDAGTPRTYGAEDKTDNRSAFGSALADVGTANYGREGQTPVLAFDCDLAGSVKLNAFEKACPDWFLQMGIQEHSTATISGAASAAGAVALWADFGVFGLAEAYNQQRLNDINHTNAKLVLTHVGLDVGEDGMTHQNIDYVGLLRNTFGWKLVMPADPNQTDRATRWALSSWGNACLAMGRSKLPVITDEKGNPFFAGDYIFQYGAVDFLRDGTDVTLIAMGHMAYRALQAREILAKQGVSARVVHVSSPLAIDRGELKRAVSTGAVVTYEDHNVNSGLGSIVAAALLEEGVSVRFRALGVHRYGDSGNSDEVMARMGLSPASLAETARGLLG